MTADVGARIPVLVQRPFQCAPLPHSPWSRGDQGSHKRGSLERAVETVKARPQDKSTLSEGRKKGSWEGRKKYLEKPSDSSKEAIADRI